MTLDELMDWEGFDALQVEFEADLARVRGILRSAGDKTSDPFVVGATTEGDPIIRYGEPLTDGVRKAFRRNGIRWKKWVLLQPGPPSEDGLGRGWSERGEWVPARKKAPTQEQERLGQKSRLDRLWGQTRFG